MGVVSRPHPLNKKKWVSNPTLPYGEGYIPSKNKVPMGTFFVHMGKKVPSMEQKVLFGQMLKIQTSHGNNFVHMGTIKVPMELFFVPLTVG